MPIPVPVPGSAMAVSIDENSRVENFVSALVQLLKNGTSGLIVSGKNAADPLMFPDPTSPNPSALQPFNANTDTSQLYLRQTGFAILRGLFTADYGTDSSGTPGAATIDKLCGISAIALNASSVTINNNLVTTTSHILVTWHGDHGAARWWVVRGANSFTVTLSTNATAATAFSWAVKTSLL